MESIAGTGCQKPSAPSATVGSAAGAQRPRGKQRSVGKYHLLLRTKGEELHLFIGTGDQQNPTPAPRTGSDGFLVSLIPVGLPPGKGIYARFYKAPASQRPKGETEGCSHFVAKVPGLETMEIRQVSVDLELDGKNETIMWMGSFSPKDFEPYEG
jgi:hypothetical protein